MSCRSTVPDAVDFPFAPNLVHLREASLTAIALTLACVASVGRAADELPRDAAHCDESEIQVVCRPDEAAEYQPVPGFLKLPDSVRLGPCSAVTINSRGDLYLFHRGPQPILCFDSSGRFLRSWGDDLIGMAHGMRVDRDDNVWVTDIGHHLVFKFSSDGKLLLALGTSDRPGAGPDQFNKPTDIAFGPHGEIFVADGYENSRVVKFVGPGKFVSEWGTAGSQPGEFHLPHSIVVDSLQRVLVGDRENDRIQVFDLEGRQIEVWNGFAPYGIAIDSSQQIFIADGRANQILRLNDKGRVVMRLGSKGHAVGQFELPHMLTVDHEGSLYVAEVGGKRFQKFRLTNSVSGTAD